MRDDDKTTSPPIVPLMPTGNGVTDLETAREQTATANSEQSEEVDSDDTAEGLPLGARPRLSE